MSAPPVAPSGWPIAMEPPTTLSFSSGTPRSRCRRRATDAKASLISTRSMSSIVSPALASALRAAGPGPISMMMGSVATRAVETTRPRGVRPRSLPTASEPIMTSDAPSTMPLELPGVWTCSIHSTSVYLDRAIASKPIFPSAVKLGLSLASAAMSVSGFRKSSRWRTTMPFSSLTGTTERSNQPLSRACVASFWLRTAKRSTSSRVHPSSVAIRSAPMPCGTNPVLSALSGSSLNGPPSAPIGTRLMLS